MRVHPSCFALAALCAAYGMAAELFLTLLFITLHELCHMAAAKRLGAGVSCMSVTPVGECARLTGFFRLTFKGRCFVIICGPALNAVMAGLFYASSGGHGILGICADINAAIACFNIIPAMPLDGGRLMLTALGRRLGVVRAAGMMKRISRTLAAFIGILGIIQLILFPYNISLIIVGIFIWSLAEKERELAVAELFSCIGEECRIRPDKPRFVLLNGGGRELLRHLNFDDYIIGVCVSQCSGGEKHIVLVPMERAAELFE